MASYRQSRNLETFSHKPIKIGFIEFQVHLKASNLDAEISVMLESNTFPEPSAYYDC